MLAHDRRAVFSRACMGQLSGPYSQPQVVVDGDGIHLFLARKRTIAIEDNVEVSEVKIGCKPGIGHVPIMKDRLPWWLR